MIVKFLFQKNVKNKRILTGLVEDDAQIEYDPLREIPMVEEDSVVLKEGQRKISNFGEQFYAVFEGEGHKGYLNLNDYLLKVKVNVSEVICFASSLTKEMIESILFNTNYLDTEDDYKYVPSGLTLLDNLEYDDIYRTFFRHVEDDVYVEFLKKTTPEFLSFVDGKYVLVDDFSKALRVYKKDVRNLLLIEGFINKATKKVDVAMSHENVFTKSPLEYIFGGDNSFSVSFIEQNLVVTKNPTLTCEYRLADDKNRSQLLRNILYALKKPHDKETRVLKINDMYIKKNAELNYSLVSNASAASNITVFEIEIIKNAISLFMREPQIVELNAISENTYYLYNDNSNYTLTSNILNLKSKIVSKNLAHEFFDTFNNFNNDGNIILKSNNSYIRLDFVDKENFKISYLKTALLASKFSDEEVKALETLLDTKYSRREFNKIFNANDYLRIEKKDVVSLEKQYKDIIEEKNKTNIRFSQITNLANIKTTSDKGSFEYYESLYMKSYLDSYKLFNVVLPRVNNVLLVGTVSNIDLTALSVSSTKLNKNINVSVLDTNKWGYYPKCYVSGNVNLEGVYRLDLSNLSLDFVKQFDLIFIGKHFKDVDNTLLDFVETLKDNDYEGFILNESYNKEYGFVSNFDNALEQTYEYQKRLIIQTEEPIGLSILDNKLSHYSILRIKNKKVKDPTKK